MKKPWLADDFSYFIRYFALFTLIFSAMTLIILQIMRSGLYRTVDDNLLSLSQSPDAVFRLGTDLIQKRDEEKEDDRDDNQGQDSSQKQEGQTKMNYNGRQTWLSPKEAFLPPDNTSVNSNTQVVFFDESGKGVNTKNPFFDESSLDFKKSYLNKIKIVEVTNSYGYSESYRALFLDVDKDDRYNGVQYAALMVNINQLEQTSKNHEEVIVVVMISFWLISVLASIYLARVSVKPLIESIEKQQGFVENASHELRTPLTVLQNRLESLFRKPEATILECSESIASSLEEVRNMRILTSNLLNLARRDDGLNPEMEEVPASYFDTIFENYSLVAEDSGKTFLFENHLMGVMRTDKTLLRQVLTILFDNAMKYTDEDGQIFIGIYAKERDRQVTIRVKDDGPGIANKDKKRIFDRFYRVDKARTRQKGGFGLGLSLAKQIIDALHGSIQVKDNKPHGSIFELRIPR